MDDLSVRTLLEPANSKILIFLSFTFQNLCRYRLLSFDGSRRQHFDICLLCFRNSYIVGIGLMCDDERLNAGAEMIAFTDSVILLPLYLTFFCNKVESSKGVGT